MCGIFGMTGVGAVAGTLKALKLLEYRGYDSAGIAARREGRIDICKTEGRVAKLEELVCSLKETDVAIGHTRWATHGAVCTANAHPFLSQNGKFAIVHNGIIENYLELKKKLGDDVHFTSQTDSETVAHLLERNYQGNVLDAVLHTARQLKGSFAIVITTVYDEKLYAIKSKSPLIAGISQKGACFCSDIRCVSHWATSVAVTPDNTVAELSSDGVRFFDFSGNPLSVPFFAPEKAEAYESVEGDFMLKEIREIPARLRIAKEGYVRSGGLHLSVEEARRLKRIYLIGCGTAYNSGLQVAAVARQWLNLDIFSVIASEFIYDNYIADGRSLFFFISQSGETADTVRAAERVTKSGGLTYAVTNTSESSLTFVCKRTTNIYAGAEYAVASTKAYNCQLQTLTLLLLDLGRMRGSVSDALYMEIFGGMNFLPEAIGDIIDNSRILINLAETIKDCSAVFYIGRTADYPTACEGSLKLKEISYLHSEAYPAGELKHGTLALMDPAVAVVAISTCDALRDKMASSITEVTSRGARVISVSPDVFTDATPVILPKIHPALAGIVSVVPLQLLAYYVAKALGRDVDKPRNLAKSVTVE